MKKKFIFLTSVVILCVAIVSISHSNAEVESEYEGGHGGVLSLRGMTEIKDTRKADPMKRVQKDRSPIDRDYVYQPPLVPHQTRHYEVSLNANKCLSCHSWKYAGEMGATKISVTHYESRDEQVLSDVSPRRYFCLQCHVTQADAAPLIDNDFTRVDSLR